MKGLLVLAWREAAAAAVPACLAESAESVAVALDSSCSHVRVQRLLEATRSQAVILARQQRELQATNAELARADRYKSEFLANMSHELRTPLNSMLIMSQVLAENRRGRLAEDEVDAALTINRAGSELLLIINDILDMTRVEAGKLDLQPDRVDPRALVADLDDLFRPVADQRDLVYRVETAADVPDVLVSDPLRLRQILKNLLNNAFKFTERGGVTLAVRPALPHELPATPAPGTWLAFAVTDTGIGMDEATAARVREPFFQGDSSIGRRYGGSGLGLSICWRLAELLEGCLSVASVPGRGSSFVLALPAAGGPRPADPPRLRRRRRRRTPIRSPPGRGAWPAAGCCWRTTTCARSTACPTCWTAWGAGCTSPATRSEAGELATRPAGTWTCSAPAPRLFAGREDDLRSSPGGRSRPAAACGWATSPRPPPGCSRRRRGPGQTAGCRPHRAGLRWHSGRRQPADGLRAGGKETDVADADRLKILVVDDRAENMQAMVRLLERPDLEILTASSGNEALGLMLDQDLALVLLDVQMPHMNGFEVAELMRRNERTSRVPIIFVTAINKERRQIFTGYEAGCVDYLFKPVDPFILRAKVVGLPGDEERASWPASACCGS